MNQERFDELTKGLATIQLSRRHVVKTLAASAVISMFSPFVSKRAHAAKPIRKPPKCRPKDEGLPCAECGICMNGRCVALFGVCEPNDEASCSYCDAATLTCTSPTVCANCELCSANQGCVPADELMCGKCGSCDPATGQCANKCTNKCEACDPVDGTCKRKPECNVSCARCDPDRGCVSNCGGSDCYQCNTATGGCDYI